VIPDSGVVRDEGSPVVPVRPAEAVLLGLRPRHREPRLSRLRVRNAVLSLEGGDRPACEVGFVFGVLFRPGTANQGSLVLSNGLVVRTARSHRPSLAAGSRVAGSESFVVDPLNANMAVLSLM
jgi:hypothetical protein